MPPFVQTMLERRWLGDKTKQGFYKKEKDAAGKEVRLVLDWKTLEYVPAIRPKIPSLEMAKNAEQLPERLRAIAGRRCPQGQGGALPLAAAERACGTMRRIACRRSPTMRPSVDRAMRAGFNWEMGPFQLWDAAGVRRDRAAHAERRRAGEPDCRTPAGGRRRRLVPGSRTRVLRREQRRVSAGCRGRGHRRASPNSARRTAWCGRIPGRRWWIWATAWPAWNCTRRRTPSAKTSCAW